MKQPTCCARVHARGRVQRAELKIEMPSAMMDKPLPSSRVEIGLPSVVAANPVR